MFKSIIRKTRVFSAYAGALAVSAFLVASCTKDSPLQNKIDDTWKLSGTVQDGYQGKALAGAIVTYSDRDGNLKTETTDTVNGSFTCKNLPAGELTINVKAKADSSAVAVKYTATVLKIASGPKDQALSDTNNVNNQYKFRDTSIVVNLYPLSGAITGKVQARKHQLATAVAAGGVHVVVTYSDTILDMKYASPRSFDVVADTNGVFTVTGLPLAPMPRVRVIGASVAGLDYVDKVIEPSTLAKAAISVGTITLDQTLESSNFSYLFNSFPSAVVLPSDSLGFAFTDSVDPVSYAVITTSGAVGSTVRLSTVIDGASFIVVPSSPLVAGKTYTVAIFVYGVKGGSYTNTYTVTASSSDISAIASSNVIGADKLPINGLGLTDSMYFNFTDEIASGSAVVTRAGTIDLVTVTAAGKRIVITPKGSWLAGTVYSVAVTATLKNGSPVSFTFNITTEGGLAFISSNVFIPAVTGVLVPKNGIAPDQNILVGANKPLTAASASIVGAGAGSAPVPVAVTVTGNNVTVAPNTPLKFGTSYVFKITVTTATGESFSLNGNTGVSFTTTASMFYVKNSNTCIGADSSSPVLTFNPHNKMIVKMSSVVKSATAQLLTPAPGYATAVNCRVTVSADSIYITPEVALTEGAAYKLNIFAEDTNGVKFTGNIVTGLIAQSQIYLLESNVISNVTGVNLTGVPINVRPFVRLVAPNGLDSSSIVGLIGTANPITAANRIATTTIVKGDSVIVVPATNLLYNTPYFISVQGKDLNGEAFAIAGAAYTFTTRLDGGIFVVWSNVANNQMQGLTDVPVTQTIKIKLSSTPKPGSVTFGTTLPAFGNAVFSVVGDTIVIDPVTNMAYSTAYSFNITGLDVNGLTFTNLTPYSAPSTSFKTQQNVFVVASNTIDANGNPIETFDRYGAMWIKFSEPLSTVKTEYTYAAYAQANGIGASPLAAGGTAIVGEGVSATPNATVRISGDTLFVTPDNRVVIDYGTQVGFNVIIKTATGKTAVFGTSVKTVPLNLFIKSTNTKDINGNMRTDFGYRDTVFLVSNLKIDSIVAVTPHAAGGVWSALPDAAANLVKSRSWLSATGDTIFYVPSAKTSANSQYGLIYQVHLKDKPKGDSYYDNLPEISWKTKVGVDISAINVLANSTAYRAFKIIGDSIVITFTKAIDTSWNAPKPFKVYSFGSNPAAGEWLTGKFTKTWNAGRTQVTLKNTDTLVARAYTSDVTDYTTNNTTYDVRLAIQLTCTDGEEVAAANPAGTGNALAGNNGLVGPIAIKTEYKIALVGANFIENHNTLVAIAVGETPKDTFALAGTPTLIFNRAVDTAKIKADAVNQYVNYINLFKMGSTAKLQFTLAFSADAKTITMTPVSPFIQAGSYNIVLVKIPGIGLNVGANFVSAGDVGSILTGAAAAAPALVNRDFMAKPTADIDISALTVSLYKDTLDTANHTLLNRFGYTPRAQAGLTYGGGSGVTGQGLFDIRILKTAWNQQYNDSIDDYQVRVRSGNGDWYILGGVIPKGVVYNPFNTTVMGTDKWVVTTVNVAADVAYTNLTVKDGDGVTGLLNYKNGDDMLNDSAVVQMQVRARKNNAGGYSYSQWSSSISYVDNVAPGDTDYVAAVDLSTANISGTTWNRTATTADSSNYLTITFPEDMDVFANSPAITFYDGTPTTWTAPSKAGNSVWIDARTYRLYVKVPAGNNYIGAGWYYRVNVAGMKDYSGVTLQASGNVGTAPGGPGIAYNAIAGQVQGNVAVGPGGAEVGYYQAP